jgi:glucokinase
LLAAGIEALLDQRDRRALIGIGVAVPGLIDPDGNHVADPVFNWDSVPLTDLLSRRAGVPVTVVDRGNAAALGEIGACGARRGQPRNDLVYFYLGAGVGGALVFGNALHTGLNHTAGELGHMTVDPSGQVCKCGNRGCLETFVSTGAIASRARVEIAAGRPTVLAQRLDAHASDEEVVAAMLPAARDGDLIARAIMDDAARYLGTAVASLVNVLDPTAVILGGPTARWWGDALVAATRAEAARRVLPIPLRTLHLMLGEAEEVSVPLGAVVQVRERVGDLLAVRPSEPLINDGATSSENEEDMAT